MVTTKKANEIVEAVMERIEIEGIREDAYPILSVKERSELISIIKDMVEGK